MISPSFLRGAIAWLLAALLAVSSVQAGAARGQAKVAGEVVLCTGTGPVAVRVDDAGQPVGAAHPCPDCVMTLFAGLAGLVPSARLGLARSMDLRISRMPGPAARHPRQRWHARAPPRFS